MLAASYIIPYTCKANVNLQIVEKKLDGLHIVLTAHSAIAVGLQRNREIVDFLNSEKSNDTNNYKRFKSVNWWYRFHANFTRL